MRGREGKRREERGRERNGREASGMKEEREERKEEGRIPDVLILGPGRATTGLSSPLLG